jgi:hypothetical protein
MEPDAPELRERLVTLRLQKTELDRDIARLQENLQTGRADLSPEKLKILSIEMRRRLAEGPPGTAAGVYEASARQRRCRPSFDPP